jgi:predicted nucleic acid-binding protein
VTRYVIDASAAVEYLPRTQLGQKIAEIIRDALLIAPALLDVEVLSVLRRAVLHKKLEEQRAALALEDLVAW